MKTFLYSLLLCAAFLAPTWAATDTAQAISEDPGVETQIDLNVDNGDNADISENDLERKIKGKIFSIITDIIKAADDDLSEEEKNEIKDEIRDAITEIKTIEEENGGSHGIRIGSDEPFFMQAALGAMAIFFIFGTPIMIIAAVLYSSYRKKRLMHETIDQYVANGKDIPPEVLQSLQKETAPRNNLHRGLIMSGLGLGIVTCFAVIGSLETSALGLIPLFIGLAQLLIWKLENR